MRIEPPRSWRPLNLAELWHYRELLYFFVWRDVKVRYKQTVLGAAWAVIQPLAATILFAIFFGHLGGMSKQVSGPYALFLFVGLQPWTFFANGVTMASTSLLGSSHLISKVYFPRLLVPLAAILAGLVDFLVTFAFMLVLMAWYGVTPTVSLLLAPVFVAGIVMAATGIGILFAAMIVAYRDIRYVTGYLVQLWLFATPVLYPLDVIPQKWRLLYAVNPMTGMIAGFRAAILGGAVATDVILVSTLSAVALLAIGTQYFVQVERRFADII